MFQTEPNYPHVAGNSFCINEQEQANGTAKLVLVPISTIARSRITTTSAEPYESIFRSVSSTPTNGQTQSTNLIETNKERRMSPPKRHTLLRFTKPFLRFIVALTTGRSLLALSQIKPTWFPSPDTIGLLYNMAARILLASDFIALWFFENQYFRFLRRLLAPVPTTIAKYLYRKTGRHGWHACYIIAQPVLFVAIPITTIVIIRVLLHLFQQARPGPGIEAIKWTGNLLALLGLTGLMWAAFNYLTEKNWNNQAIGSVFCFAFAAVAHLAYSFTQPLNPEALISPFSR